MMRMNNIQMKTRVSKTKLLELLKSNLSTHKQIVAEAKVGYLKKAKEELEWRLKSFDEGKPCSLQINLYPPEDHSTVYKTTIKMVDMNEDETIVLSPDEFRQLVEDEWDWKGNFIHSNAGYSATANRLCVDRGSSEEEDDAVGAVGGAPPVSFSNTSAPQNTSNVK